MLSRHTCQRSDDATRELVEPLLDEPVERYALDNGLTVILKPDSSNALCSVQVWVKTGSVHEGRYLGSGVSHFVEHMLFKGTERRQGREISEAAHAVGGELNAYTSFDRTVYHLDLPSESVDVALDLLSDAVFRSVMPETEFEKERDVILREIAMDEDDPDGKLAKALFETAFRENNYRCPIIGYKEVFSRLDREALVSYYRERYVPNNAALVIAGDFEIEAMRELVEKRFGVFERRPLPPVYLPDEPRQLAMRERLLREDVTVSRVGLGFQAPGIAHADTPALDALALVLGSGHSSLLYRELRERRRLAHTLDAFNWTPGVLGLFYLSFVCDSDKRAAATEAALEAIERLDERVITPERVSKAARQLLVAEIGALKTAAGQAGRLGAAEVVAGDIGYARNYLRRVAELAPDDLLRAGRAWLQPQRLTSVAMEPRAGAAPARAVRTHRRAEARFEVAAQPNGSRLLLRENRRLPNIHLRFALQGGALWEPPGKQGLTRILATLLSKDTAKRDAASVAEAIESVGGAFHAVSGNNSLAVAIETMPSDLDLALDLLEEAILRPKFLPSTFALEKEGQLAGVREQLDDVVTAGRRALRKRFFGGHPFRIGGSGDPETLESLRLEDVVALWARLLRAGNAALAVSGDFDRAALRPRLEALLARLPGGAAERPRVAFEGPAEPGSHRLALDRSQAVVYRAYPGPGLTGDDFVLSEVADELFSGMSSQLFDRVREQLGLAYFAQSSRIIGLDTAMFYFCVGTAPGSVEVVAAELERERRRVAEGKVEATELRRCQTRLKAARRMGLQSNSARAGHAAMNAIYGLPVNDQEEYECRVDAVTVEDLARFAGEFLAPEACVELVAGDVGKA